jgi:hypothetical protein
MSDRTRPVALVTGASGGIGADLARELAAAGHDLILAARSERALQELAAELQARHGIAATVITADLAKPGAAAALFAAVEARGRPVEVLVNNAGFGDGGRFDQEDPARIEAMIAVNIAALTSLARLFLPDLVARRRGRILNVASTAAFQPGPMMAVYCATKAYVLSLSLALSEELRGSGVTVTALCPGATATNFAAAARVEKNPLFAASSLMVGRPDWVARRGVAALLRGSRLVVPGLANWFGAVMAGVMPYGLVLPMAKRMLATGQE